MDILNILLEISIYSAVIFFAVMCVKKVFHKQMSPLLHYAVWALLIVRLMMPVTIDSSLKLFVIPSEAAAQQTAQTTAQLPVADTHDTVWTSGESAGIGDIARQRQTLAEMASETQTETYAVNTTRTHLSTTDLMLMIWLAGIVLASVYVAAAYIVTKRRMTHGAVPVSAHVRELFDACRQELGIRGRLKIIGTAGIVSPALFFPRTVLMPVNALQSMSNVQIRFVLRHELTHYRRCDHVMSFALVLLQAVYWFNPFVWLAFRQIRLDMEVACDNSVVGTMDGADKMAYASTVLSMFSRQKRFAAMLGMAMVNTKTTAEKRIRGIFARRRSSRKARMSAVLMAAVLLVTCFTTACQPTPETPPIVNKGDGKLRETIEQSAAPAEKYSAPDTWQDEFKREGSTLTVKVAASVNVPDVERFPIVEIGPADFSQSEVDHLVDLFTDGAPLYEYDLPMTKAQYQERILEVQAELAMADDPEADLPPKEEIEALIADLQRRMQEAPESVEREPIDGKLKIEEGLDYETMEAAVYLGGEAPAQICVNNTSDTYLRAGFTFDNGVIFQPRKSLEGQQAKGQQMTPQEAMAAVDSMLSELGLTDMHAVSVATGVGLIDNFTPIQEDMQGYIVTCKRFVDGIPVTQAEVRGGGGGGKEVDEAIADGKIDEQQYAPYWSDGHIVVSIDDSGIRSFRWLNHGKMGEVFNENVPLMPFDEIQKKFEQQIFATYGVDAAILVIEKDGQGTKDREEITLDTVIDIYRVELGMVTIRQKDRMGSFVLVPAWTFFGKQTAVKPDGEPIVHADDEMAGYISDSLLIINAIDGSVINQNSGF